MKQPAVLVSCLVAAVLLAGCVAPQDPPGTPLTDELNRLFTSWDAPDSPGAAVIAIREGEIVFRGGFGSVDPEGDGALIDPGTTVFCIASVAKQFTAFAALLLAEDGLLDLDADVGSYLPRFPDFGTPITVRHLLHHTSGLREYSTLAYLEGERFLPDDPFLQTDAVDLTARQRELNFPPGTDMIYTNTNYMVLAELIAAVSGKSFHRFMIEEVFEPLGMDSTTIQGPTAAETVDGFVGEKDFLEMMTWGESGVLTTADDLAIWALHLLDPSYRPEAVARLFEKGRSADGDELSYAGGLLYGSSQGFETVRHGGTLHHAGYVASLELVPSQNSAVLVLGNSSDAVSRAPEVLQALLPETPTKTDAPEPADEEADGDASDYVSADDYDLWAGKYISISHAFELLVEGDELVYQSSKLKGSIRPTVEGRFKVPDRNLYVDARREDGRVRMLEVATEVNTLIYRRATLDDPESQNLDDYVGVYHSDEIALPVRIQAVDGKLTMISDSVSWPKHLLPVDEDCFRDAERNEDLGNLLIRFDRDDSGIVDRLYLDTSRVRGLRFRRDL